MEFSEHPMWIARCRGDQNGTIIINIEELKKLLCTDKLRKTPVVVVSIMGSKGTGKSFMMNYLIRYLKTMEDKSGQEWRNDRTTELKGFDWCGNQEEVRPELMIWSKPFFLLAGKQKIAYLLIDSHGLINENLNKATSLRLVYFLSAISSVQIHNVQGPLTRNILGDLALYTEYARNTFGKLKTRGPSDLKPFQRIIHLIRDWIDPKKFRYGSIGGAQYLESKTQECETETDDLLQNMKHMEDCFHTVECFLMPHPGRTAVCINEEGQSMFTGKLDQLDSRFQRKMDELFSFLFPPNENNIKTYKGDMCDGETLMHLIEMLAEQMSEKTTVSADTRGEFLHHHNIVLLEEVKRCYSSAVDEYLRTVAGHVKEHSSFKENMDYISSIFVQRIKCEAYGSDEDYKGIINSFVHFAEEKAHQSWLQHNVALSHFKIELTGKYRDALEQAKSIYKSEIKGYHCRSSEDLKLLHEAAEQQARIAYKHRTKELTGLQDPCVEEFELFILEQFKSANLTMMSVVEKKRVEALRSQRLINQAVDEYRRKMQMTYDFGKTSVTDEKLEKDHSLCINDAYIHFKSEALESNMECHDFKKALENECREFFIGFKNRNDAMRKREEQDKEVARNEFLSRVLKIYRQILIPLINHSQGVENSQRMEILNTKTFEETWEKCRKWSSGNNEEYIELAQTMCRQSFLEVQKDMENIKSEAKKSADWYKRFMAKKKVGHQGSDARRTYDYWHRDTVQKLENSVKNGLFRPFHLKLVRSLCSTVYEAAVNSFEARVTAEVKREELQRCCIRRHTENYIAELKRRCSEQDKQVNENILEQAHAEIFPVEYTRFNKEFTGICLEQENGYELLKESCSVALKLFTEGMNKTNCLFESAKEDYMDIILKKKHFDSEDLQTSYDTVVSSILGKYDTGARNLPFYLENRLRLTQFISGFHGCMLQNQRIKDMFSMFLDQICQAKMSPEESQRMVLQTFRNIPNYRLIRELFMKKCNEFKKQTDARKLDKREQKRKVPDEIAKAQHTQTELIQDGSRAPQSAPLSSRIRGTHPQPFTKNMELRLSLPSRRRSSAHFPVKAKHSLTHTMGYK